MSPLRLVKPNANGHPLSVDQLLGLLHPDKLNAIEAEIKIMREAYHCPFTVATYDEFKETIFAYFAHCQKTCFNADLKTIHNNAWKNLAYDFVQQHLGNYQGGMRAAERNAITGRDGGMIGVIDAPTDGILKYHFQIYTRGVFLDLISPSDYPLRMRLAEELLKKYGRFLFPNEELLPHYFLGVNIEEFIQGFVNHLHAIRREWRN